MKTTLNNFKVFQKFREFYKEKLMEDLTKDLELSKGH
jgi:hypothetical protein